MSLNRRPTFKLLALGFTEIDKPHPMAEEPNPYAAPSSHVDDVVLPGPESVRFVPGGRAVPVAHGWNWLVAGWDLYKRNPGAWILIFIIFTAIMMGASWVPLIGFVAMYILTPVLIGGVMMGCAALQRGQSLEVSHLFAGFREKTGALVQVGLLYLAGIVATLLVVGLIFGFSLLPTLIAQQQPEVRTAVTVIVLAVLVALALSIPLVMALWFAAPLVIFHDLPAVDALKTSFTGCLRNILPFLIYGLLALVFAIVASIPLMLGWLLLGPVLMASVYTGYRDIFTEPRTD